MKLWLIGIAILTGCVIGSSDKNGSPQPSAEETIIVAIHNSVIDGNNLTMMPSKGHDAEYNRSTYIDVVLPTNIEIVSGTGKSGDKLTYKDSDTECTYNFNTSSKKFVFASCLDGSGQVQYGKHHVYLKVLTYNSVTVMASITLVP